MSALEQFIEAIRELAGTDGSDPELLLNVIVARVPHPDAADYLSVRKLEEWSERSPSDAAKAAFVLTDERVGALTVFWIFFVPDGDDEGVTLDPETGSAAARDGVLQIEGETYRGDDVLNRLAPYFAATERLRQVLASERAW